jgi:hypothetical protein
MKIYYKTITQPQQIGVREYAHEYRVLIKYDPCCKDAKDAKDAEALDMSADKVNMMYQGYDNVETYYPAISFCPFCGMKIEFIEDYKARLERKTVSVKEKKTVKVIPAHNESRDVEVRI